MATKLFLRWNINADVHLGTNNTKLDGTTAGWTPRPLSASQGAGVTVLSGSTVAGPTSGVEIASGATAYEWLSQPVAADVTISGVITANLWCSESGMNANVAMNFVVERVAAADGAITQIVKSARTTETNLTTRAAENFTATPGAGVTLNRGDRLRVRVFGDDAGTMGAGFTFDLGLDGAAGADGDSYLSFTETITFETADPTGSQLFCTSTAAGIDPGAANEMEMWTARGGGSANLVTNTATGWTAGIQVTDSGGGTAQEWYSKQLSAFTLGGKALVNIRAKESSVSADASVRAEIAVCDADGSNPVVWGTACLAPVDSFKIGELTTTDAAWTVYVAGDDTALADGQRLRLRIYVEDIATVPLVTGFTVTVSHNGTTGGAAGDTYLILPQSVTEFVAAALATQVVAEHLPFIPKGRSF